MIEDLTGQRFGRLVVVERASDRVYPNGDRRVQWLCRCDCGSIATATANLLKRGEKKSCGCLRREVSSARKKLDLNNQRFGRLTVLHEVGVKNGVCYWSCRCDCGNHAEVSSSHLVSGATQSCGCLQKERAGAYAFKDLTGKQFGEWLVLKQFDHDTSGRIRWLCKCKRCGNVHKVSSGNLLSGGSVKCISCSHRENGERRRSDLIGNRYGLLQVIGFGGIRKNNSLWICQCDCGNKTIVSVGALTGGNTRSCGCQFRSKYEIWVTEYLESNAIRFLPQIKFNELTGVGRQRLSYDFGIYDFDGNLFRLIECQGQQHFFPVDMFGGEEQFEKQQMHDDLKREYAENVLHVPLIEIPYTMTENEVYDVLERMIDEMEAQKTKETHIRFNPGVYEGLLEIREEFGISLSKIVNLALTDNLNRFARKVRFADKKQAAEINASVLETQKSIEQIRVNLSRIGSNLNQIAKLENIKKKIAEEEAHPRPIQSIIEGYRNEAIKIEQEINSQFNADDLRELVRRFEEASERFGEAAWRIQG